MEKNNQKRAPKNQSRREFLKKAAKGGSIAALITSGALDLELKHLLFAQEAQKYLSQEALKSSLPSRGLETLRKILIGEFFPGGRFWVEGKVFSFRDGRLCDPHVLLKESGCKTFCSGDFNCDGQKGCPSNCSNDDCGDFECGTHTCPTGFTCPVHGCDNDVCGGVAGGCPMYGDRNIDPRELSAFDVGEIGKYATAQFVQELMQVMNLRTTQALEIEVEKMIRNRESLKMKGYIR